jgi:REP element-mobilizing transposase RayT
MVQICPMPTFPISGSFHLRRGRRSIPSQLYLVTTITPQRKPHFLNTELARTTVRSMSSVDLWFPSHCLCWVLMPDHWHGLIELGAGKSLSSTMQRVKGATARIVGQSCTFDGSLWDKGFHDHALRRDESIEKAARYIIANPVRAGLVGDPMDYPYWDAWFLDGES